MWSSPTTHSLHSSSRICCTFLQSTGCTAQERSRVGPGASHRLGEARRPRCQNQVPCSTLGHLFAYELGRRDNVTGEMWKNKPPFRLALNRAASDEIAWHCKHYTGRGVMKFYESGAALAQDMGVPLSKMEESIEASLKTAEDPDGGPYTAYLSG